MTNQSCRVTLVNRQRFEVSRQTSEVLPGKVTYVLGVFSPSRVISVASFVTDYDPKFHFHHERDGVMVQVQGGFFFRMSLTSAKRLAAFVGTAFP